MLTPEKVLKQINILTKELIEMGLCDAQNFPSIKKYSGNIQEIGTTNAEQSIFLKNIPYNEMFNQLVKNGTYNLKMLDGALISLQYRFKDNNLEKHRLSFFPSPDLEAFQNEAEIYLEDELYSDVLDKRIVTVPLRFDFDINEETYKPITHPISHFTLGQYKNCRIPVASALTPYQFLLFIIMNFYHTAHEKYNDKISEFKDCFETTIFQEEKALLHIYGPIYSR